MTDAKRLSRLGLVLVVIPLLLWIPPLLYFCRINGYILDRFLLKAPGLYVVYVALACCPLAALFVGRLMVRRGHDVVAGRLVMTLAGILCVAFAVVLGIPLAQQAFEVKIPKNPSTPRPIEPLAGLPVFPGAEGFGTRTRAGRGGKIIEVTSLADDGPGTLRRAIEDPQPRIIVFRTSGTIELESELFINHPFVTVAGQTAPGDGICLKNCGLVIATNDVLVQHLRIRPGNEGSIEPDVNDAVQFFGPHGDATGAWNVVLDHVSASWCEDECVSTWFGARDITICWSIISEALDRSRHRKGSHSAGLLVGNSSEHISMHHNLLAHNSFRNPLIIDGGTHDVVNNVIYNWGKIPSEVVDYDANSFLNFIGNYYKRGPSLDDSPWDIVLNSHNGSPKIYTQGNFDTVRSNESSDDWQLVTFGFGGEPAAQQFRAMQRFPTPPITTSTAQEAFEQVLAEAGATKPSRDSVDDRIVADARNGTGQIINSPAEVGGYPELQAAPPPLDSDHDGMPDEWELQQGLDPQDPTDGNADQDEDGYTNVEEYLHWLL